MLWHQMDVPQAWTTAEHFLANISDHQHWLVWSKTKDAEKAGSKPPKPIRRPGQQINPEGWEGLQGTPTEIEDLNDFLGWDAHTMGVNCTDPDCARCAQN